jgi:hypothetical protein
VALEQVDVDVRLAACEALQEPGGGQLDQVAKTGVAGGEERQVVGPFARSPSPLLRGGARVVDEICLEAQDRLDPLCAAGLVMLHSSVHHAVIGESQSRHPKLRRPRRHGVDLARAVQQRVLAVNVQMNRRPAHRAIIATTPDGMGERPRNVGGSGT